MGQIATGNPSAGGGGLGSLFSAFTGNARTRLMQQRIDEARQRDAARAAQGQATAAETARHNQATEKIQQDQEAGRISAAAATQRRADEKAATEEKAAKIAEYYRKVNAIHQNWEDQGKVRQEGLENFKAQNPVNRPDILPVPVAPTLAEDPYKEYLGKPEQRAAVQTEILHNLEQRIGPPPAPGGMSTGTPEWDAKNEPNLIKSLPPNYLSQAIDRVGQYLKAGHSLQDAVNNTDAELMGTKPAYAPGKEAVPAYGGWLGSGFRATDAVPAVLPTVTPDTQRQAPADLADAIKSGPYATNEAALAQAEAEKKAYAASVAANKNYVAPSPPTNLTAPLPPPDYSGIPLPAPDFVPPTFVTQANPVPTPPTPPTMSTPAQTVAPVATTVPTAPAATAPATTAPAVPTADSNAPTAATEPPTTWKKTKGGIVYSD
jgi:hypothetical protein